MIPEIAGLIGLKITESCICNTVDKQNQLSCIARSVLHFLYLKAGEAGLLRPSTAQMDSDTALWGEWPYSAVLPKVAFLCDEMTWQDFRNYCNGIFLHPRLWAEQLAHFKPDFFFCEAAWTGIKGYEGVWRGRVYRDHRLVFDNRGILLDILSYCRKHGIPTLFWGKEDPTFFQHPVYDFTETALSFDFIVATALECVDRYRALGHPRVSLLPFGVDTNLFHPVDYPPEPGTAVFAGSWFNDQPSRCEFLEKLLDFSINHGLRLDIYNRKFDAKQKRFRFPDKYLPYLRPPVPYEETPALFHRYEYAINVNTVTESATMCSRRLLQLAANGATILSNETPAFSSLSDCLEVYPTGEPGLVYVRGNIAQIEAKYSIRHQFFNISAYCGCSAAEKERAFHGTPVG